MGFVTKILIRDDLDEFENMMMAFENDRFTPTRPFTVKLFQYRLELLVLKCSTFDYDDVTPEEELTNYGFTRTEIDAVWYWTDSLLRKFLTALGLNVTHKSTLPRFVVRGTFIEFGIGTN